VTSPGESVTAGSILAPFAQLTSYGTSNSAGGIEPDRSRQAGDRRFRSNPKPNGLRAPLARFPIRIDRASVTARGRSILMQRIAIPSPIGDIHCEQFGEASSDALIRVFGAGSGFGGPARGVYTRLGEQLADEQIGSLCLDYRRPAYLQPCVADASEAIGYLSRLGANGFFSLATLSVAPS